MLGLLAQPAAEEGAAHALLDEVHERSGHEEADKQLLGMHAQEALPARLPREADRAQQLGQVPGHGHKKALQGDVHLDPHLHITHGCLGAPQVLKIDYRAHAPAQRCFADVQTEA